MPEGFGHSSLKCPWWLFSSCWEEASCVLPQTHILEEWVDCRGVSTVPCLTVTVSVTGSNESAFLQFDEDSVFLPNEVHVFLNHSKLPGSLDVTCDSAPKLTEIIMAKDGRASSDGIDAKLKIWSPWIDDTSVLADPEATSDLDCFSSVPVFLSPQVPTGQKRASGRSAESKKVGGRPAEEQLHVFQWPKGAPQPCHPEQEVHHAEGAVRTAVALSDAGWRIFIGGTCEADTVLGPSVHWCEKLFQRRKADFEIHSGQNVQTPPEVKHAIYLVTYGGTHTGWIWGSETFCGLWDHKKKEGWEYHLTGQKKSLRFKSPEIYIFLNPVIPEELVIDQVRPNLIRSKSYGDYLISLQFEPMVVK